MNTVWILFYLRCRTVERKSFADMEVNFHKFIITVYSHEIPILRLINNPSYMTKATAFFFFFEDFWRLAINWICLLFAASPSFTLYLEI